MIYPGPKTITYDHDPVGNREVLIDPDGGRTAYSYTDRYLLRTLLSPRNELAPGSMVRWGG